MDPHTSCTSSLKNASYEGKKNDSSAESTACQERKKKNIERSILKKVLSGKRKARRISGARKNGNDVEFLVEWEGNGSSVLSNSFVKKYFKKQLLSYYEDRIVFEKPLDEEASTTNVP